MLKRKIIKTKGDPVGLEKLANFAITVVVMAAVAGNLDRLNLWVQVATQKILWESRASAWGSPNFFLEGYEVIKVHKAKR
jgi:hypothetical protein